MSYTLYIVSESVLYTTYIASKSASFYTLSVRSEVALSFTLDAPEDGRWLYFKGHTPGTMEGLAEPLRLALAVPCRSKSVKKCIIDTI